MGSIGGIQPTVEVDAGSEDFLPNIVHGLADEWESETMVLRFDQLRHLRRRRQRLLQPLSGAEPRPARHGRHRRYVLQQALRISMGRYTTDADIAAFEKALNKVLNW